jgi:ADP-ribose pyrophosphatase
MENTTVGQGRFLRLVSADGWEFAERIRASGVVVIVPITALGELVFVEQYRPPLQSNCLEFPAGLAGDLVDAADESLLVAARRELLEETGYEADDWQLLARAAPTAGLTSEVMTYFAARGLRQVARGGGVDDEQIVTHLVPLSQVRTWLAEQARRVVVSATVYSGLYLTGQ